MVALQEVYQGKPPDAGALWSPGDFCVALRPEDVRWYRAKIEKLNNDDTASVGIL